MQKSTSDGFNPERLRLLVDIEDPIKIVPSTLANIDDLEQARTDNDEPIEISLKHELELDEPMPTEPCIE